MIDGDIASFDMHGQDKTILELSEKAGLDAPFSCRGGVCSSCRAKVLKGSAAMRMNHTLTDSGHATIDKGKALADNGDPAPPAVASWFKNIIQPAHNPADPTEQTKSV